MKRIWLPAVLIGSTYLLGCTSNPGISAPSYAAGHFKSGSSLASLGPLRPAAIEPATLVRTAPTSAAPVSSSGANLKMSSAPASVAPPQPEDDGNPSEAMGTPTDPLRPDTSLNLSDLSANQDLWGRIRQGFAMPDLQTGLVNDHEQWYASRPDYVQRMTERSSRYLFHIVEEIQRRKMPTELALLPFIESAFNPQAISSARASGMWQFMPATGKDFELKQNLFRDDRRDVLASTRAALDYLQRLYNQFGDWHLALAAYNWGEGNVQRAVSKNLRAGLPTDYISLNMPAETRNYVPKLLAVKNIVAHPETYGLTLPPIENHPYFVSVPLQRDMDAALAARLAGLPLDEFKALNPSLNKPVILAAGTPQVLLPYDNASLFAHNLAEFKGPLASWTAWVVPRTMRPSDAAREVGMSESALREVNRIPPKMLVKAGSALLVPRSQHRVQDVSESVADNAMIALAPDVPPLKRLTLKAGKRDTVASVARRYGVNTQQVASWNKVAANSTFKRGQAIVVYVANKPAPRVLASKRVVARVAKNSPPPAATAQRNKGRMAPATRNSRVRVASAR